MRTDARLPGSVGIENEDAAIAEEDFPWLPAGFVVVLSVEPLEAGLIVIGGYPCFDGLPGWIDRLESLDVDTTEGQALHCFSGGGARGQSLRRSRGSESARRKVAKGVFVNHLHTSAPFPCPAFSDQTSSFTEAVIACDTVALCPERANSRRFRPK